MGQKTASSRLSVQVLDKKADLLNEITSDAIFDYLDLLSDVCETLRFDEEVPPFREFGQALRPSSSEAGWMFISVRSKNLDCKHIIHEIQSQGMKLKMPDEHAHPCLIYFKNSADKKEASLILSKVKQGRLHCKATVHLTYEKFMSYQLFKGACKHNQVELQDRQIQACYRPLRDKAKHNLLFRKALKEFEAKYRQGLISYLYKRKIGGLPDEVMDALKFAGRVTHKLELPVSLRWRIHQDYIFYRKAQYNFPEGLFKVDEAEKLEFCGNNLFQQLKNPAVKFDTFNTLALRNNGRVVSYEFTYRPGEFGLMSTREGFQQKDALVYGLRFHEMREADMYLWNEDGSVTRKEGERV